MRFHTVLCNHAMRLAGVPMTARELTRWTRAPDLPGLLWSHHAGPLHDPSYDRPAVPTLAYRALCKLQGSEPWMDAWVRLRALREIRPGEIVYLYPRYGLDFERRVRDRGAVLVLERINCLGPTCRAALEPAFARHGRALPTDAFSPEWNAAEHAEIALCDYATAPNPFVARSLLEAGVPGERILETSYGWSPERLAAGIGVERPDRDPVFLFVGIGILRKGLDLLLESWEQADVRGTLIIAGSIHDEIRSVCGRQLSRPDVRTTGFVEDIASVYAAADVFVFPTHEEGGPQVTYEAAACGLPCIVSPMGAGRIVTDGREGRVIDPWDRERWVEALREMARDAGLRRRMGAQAAQTAQEFTWERVGGRLRAHFRRILGAAPVAAVG